MRTNIEATHQNPESRIGELVRYFLPKATQDQIDAIAFAMQQAYEEAADAEGLL